MIDIMPIRAAVDSDADEMAVLLNEIISIGGTTAHTRLFDRDRILGTFITAPRAVSCFAASEADRVVGFQALEWSDPDWPHDDGLPPDWAIISTYVRHGHHGRGIGGALFGQTLSAARIAGVRFIDATIRRENAGGLAFYGRLGFEEYRRTEHAISKRLAP